MRLRRRSYQPARRGSPPRQVDRTADAVCQQRCVDRIDTPAWRDGDNDRDRLGRIFRALVLRPCGGREQECRDDNCDKFQHRATLEHVGQRWNGAYPALPFAGRLATCPTPFRPGSAEFHVAGSDNAARAGHSVSYEIPMNGRQFVYHMSGLTKTYPGNRKVLENVHLSFYPDAKIGVLGVNGAGKSTTAADHGGNRQGLFRRSLGGARCARRLSAAGAAARSRTLRPPRT